MDEKGATFDFGGELWLTYWESACPRSDLKAAGGKIIATRQDGSELTRQIWQTPDGKHWLGDDWYSDDQALLYEAFHCRMASN